jgi:hypothetical protein
MAMEDSYVESRKKVWAIRRASKKKADDNTVGRAHADRF